MTTLNLKRFTLHLAVDKPIGGLFPSFDRGIPVQLSNVSLVSRAFRCEDVGTSPLRRTETHDINHHIFTDSIAVVDPLL